MFDRARTVTPSKRGQVSRVITPPARRRETWPERSSSDTVSSSVRSSLDVASSPPLRVVTAAPASPARSTPRCACGGSCPRCEQAESGDDSLEQTTHSGSTSGNSFSATFDPRTSTPVPDCDRIVITQSIQMIADGTAIMPGTYYSPWTCRDPTALSDGTYLDHGKCTYTTPYPVDRGIGTAGHSNATGSSNATYSDAPITSGGDRGFRSAANPAGWETVTYKFENYALCALGAECVAASPGGPTWYDGVAWEYTKTMADHAAGRPGAATATASLTPPAAGSTILRAFDQYNSVKGFTPC
jgi:hypothetical protein